MAQMRHDNLANVLLLVVSACSCQWAAESRNQALAGEKGMPECQRRGDISAVLLRLKLAVVDVVVAHASAHRAQAAKKPGRRKTDQADAVQEACARSCCIPVCAVSSGYVPVHEQGGRAP